MRIALVSQHENETNLRLAEAAPAGVEVEIVPPTATLGRLGPGDAALGRLDVLPSLDGIEPGSWELSRLEADGIVVFNRLRTLLATHDKLRTSRLLRGANLPHPRTAHLVAPQGIVPLEPPVVVKPRFGSWGRDVVLATTPKELMDCLAELSGRPWFQRSGVLVQELVPPMGHDLRLVVAGGQVIGGVRRRAAEGEWRTNVALGATREATEPPRAAIEVALAAASAVGADLVGVDLMPTRDGGWMVIELNGAVEFTDEYSLDRDIFKVAIEVLVDAVSSRRANPLAALA